MSAILKFDFQERKQLRFSEVNYLNYTKKKRPNFACGNYIFPETRWNKNKPWTHSTLLNMYGSTLGSRPSFEVGSLNSSNIYRLYRKDWNSSIRSDPDRTVISSNNV